jgi:predicted transcriptional regulator
MSDQAELDAIEGTPPAAARLTDEERAERRAQVLSLSNAGMPLTKIADKLGITRVTARKDLYQAYEDIIATPVEQFVARQVGTLRDVRAAMYRSLLEGDDKAARVIVSAADRESKLLGLDAPQRVLVGVTDAQFAVTAAKLMREIGMEPPVEWAKAEAVAPTPLAIAGPIAADEDVPSAVAEVDTEPELPEEWVL